MKKRLNYLLFISLIGNVGMIVARIIYTHDFYCGFLLWNLFLAGIPLMISTLILRVKTRSGVALFCMLSVWLLFLPNAPYVITDLVHLYERPPVPFWYDMVVMLLSAMNGLILGFSSIIQIEGIVKKELPGVNSNVVRLFTILAMSYGVYLGRYLRFNSWDAIMNPLEVSQGIIQSLGIGTAGFVLTFSFLNFVFYSFFRTILLYRSQEAS